MSKISIIIPVLDEATRLEDLLKDLQPFRESGHELIIVDGGSSDDSAEIARRYADKVQVSERGRARQMNAGAEVASGDILLFLHADTVLPVSYLEKIETGIAEGEQWGRFDVRLSGERFAFRIIEFFINLRSRLTSIATGDQAIFIRRALFEAVGGFPDIALMEDVAICKVLRRKMKPLCLHEKVITSSRRWEEFGVLRTVLLMWRLRLFYFLGVSPDRLARSYR